MLVQSISKLDQVDMRYEMGVFLRQEWTDPRLDFRPGYYTDTSSLSELYQCEIKRALCLRKSDGIAKVL